MGESNFTMLKVVCVGTLVMFLVLDTTNSFKLITLDNNDTSVFNTTNVNMSSLNLTKIDVNMTLIDNKTLVIVFDNVQNGYLVYNRSMSCRVMQISNISPNADDILEIINVTYYAEVRGNETLDSDIAEEINDGLIDVVFNISSAEETGDGPIDVVYWFDLIGDNTHGTLDASSACRIVDSLITADMRTAATASNNGGHVRQKRAMVTRCYHLPRNQKICRFVGTNKKTVRL